MKALKIFISFPLEGWTAEQLEEYMELEHTRLKDTFRRYEIEFHDRRELGDNSDNFEAGINLLKTCDICAMAETWIYSEDCKKEREIAVDNGKPIVITNTEYTPKFIKDYIVGKALRNRM